MKLAITTGRTKKIQEKTIPCVKERFVLKLKSQTCCIMKIHA
ncbi:MAG: hypothetical protein ACTTJH_04515 [Bacteroidales bacterium]